MGNSHTTIAEDRRQLVVSQIPNDVGAEIIVDIGGCPKRTYIDDVHQYVFIIPGLQKCDAASIAEVR